MFVMDNLPVQDFPPVGVHTVGIWVSVGGRWAATLGKLDPSQSFIMPTNVFVSPKPPHVLIGVARGPDIAPVQHNVPVGLPAASPCTAHKHQDCDEQTQPSHDLGNNLKMVVL